MNRVWEWVYGTLPVFQRAAEQGDADRGRLAHLYREVLTEPLTLLQRDPERAYSLLTEGRAIAERIGEHGWVLLFDTWRARALRSMGAYRPARDIAMHAAIYARRPPFNQYPQRFCLHLEGVTGPFLLIDPEGYAEQIRDAFAYVESEITPDLECGWCLLINRSKLAGALEQIEEARAHAVHALSRTEGHGYREASTYHRLCELAARQDDWAAIQGWALEGEEAARRSNRLDLIAAFLAWQALVARRSGAERTARRLFRTAVTQATAIGGIATGQGSHALPACLYYQAGGEFERALAIRERQLALIAGQGLTYAECCYRLKQCMLLEQLHRPREREVTALRRAAGALIHPESFLHYLTDRNL